MRPPKHLWSGDWERDSANASEELAALVERPRVVAPESEPGVAPEPEPAPAPGIAPSERIRAYLAGAGARLGKFRLPRLRVAGALVLGIVAVLALAAGAYGLGALLATSESPSPPAAGGARGPMTWLGMEVETLNPGGVVAATVSPGSAAERAGIEPGDIIVQVNNRTVSATGDITQAIAGIPAGQRVQLEVSRGSTPYTTAVTLGAPPAKYP